MHRSITRILLACLAGVLIAPLGGCNIAAPAYFILAGPPEREASFTLPAGRATVVFVDDRTNIAPRRSLRSMAARVATETLLDKGKLKDAIDPNPAYRVANSDELVAPKSIEEIGSALEAEVVIYALIDEFNLAGNSNATGPVATVRVKVLDLTNRRRLFPNSASGFPMSVALPKPPSFGLTGRSALVELENALAQKLGLGIAQLFYEHELTQSAILR